MNFSIFQLMSHAGVTVDRLEIACPGHPTIQRVIARCTFADASVADAEDAQAALSAHIAARNAYEAQVEIDRGVIAVAQATMPKRQALELWSRQNERERTRRTADAAKLVRLRTERNETRAIARQDMSDLAGVLSDAEAELAVLELRAARLAREAATKASPARHYTPEHVADVMAAAHKADRAAAAAKEALHA